jgi:hypothetical protein
VSHRTPATGDWVTCRHIVELMVPLLTEHQQARAATIITLLTQMEADPEPGKARTIRQRLWLTFTDAEHHDRRRTGGFAFTAVHEAAAGRTWAALANADEASTGHPDLARSVARLRVSRDEHANAIAAAGAYGKFQRTAVTRALIEAETRNLPTWPQWLLSVLPLLAARLNVTGLNQLAALTFDLRQTETLTVLLRANRKPSEAITAARFA